MIVSEDAALLETSYRAIVLRDGDGSLTVSQVVENSLLELSDSGSGGPEVWVLTGSQYGPFQIVAQCLDGAPPDPDESWVDIAELSVTCTSGVHLCEMVDGPVATLATEAGTYRVRVSARGRREGSARDDDPDFDLDEEVPVLEHYLIQAWAAADDEARVVRGCADPANPTEDTAEPWPPRVPETAEALAAAAEIGRVLQRGREDAGLSGVLAALTVERVIPGARRHWFELFGGLIAWQPDWAGAASLKSERTAIGDTWFRANPFGEDGLTGGIGHIRTVVTALDKPGLVQSTWSWYVPGPGEHRALLGNGEPFLDHPSVLRFELTDTDPGDGDEPLTHVTITHSDLPVEWVEPMRAWWQMHLSLAERWPRKGWKR